MDNVNDILMAHACEVENMGEPMDFEECHPMDWAEITHLVDEVCDNLYVEPIDDLFPEDDYILMG